MLLDEKLAIELDKTLREAIAKAIERHRRLGESIAVSENGKVKILSPDEILERQQKLL
jgi:hypothetical protein